MKSLERHVLSALGLAVGLTVVPAYAQISPSAEVEESRERARPDRDHPTTPTATRQQDAPASTDRHAREDRARVRELQRTLQQAGFYGGDVDGRFGPRTQIAVRRYQASEQLPVTGELDPRTARALGVDLPASEQPVGERRAIGEGPDRNARIDVLRAQRVLSQEGAYEGPVDGRLGPDTERAIRVFQRGRDLRVTGELDRSTRRAMGIVDRQGTDPNVVAPGLQDRAARGRSVPRVAGEEVGAPERPSPRQSLSDSARPYAASPQPGGGSVEIRGGALGHTPAQLQPRVPQMPPRPAVSQPEPMTSTPMPRSTPRISQPQ